MSPNNLKFLVVDDFSTMRKIVKKSLTEMGYTTIEEAVDGANAFELLEKAKADGQPFDFVITDWNMPNMSGLDFLKKCRSTDAYKALPIILVTAESEQKQILEAIKAGCNDYVVKPFTTQLIKEKIDRVCQKLATPKAA